jgi:hypothetical protein
MNTMTLPEDPRAHNEPESEADDRRDERRSVHSLGDPIGLRLSDLAVGHRHHQHRADELEAQRRRREPAASSAGAIGSRAAVRWR